MYFSPAKTLQLHLLPDAVSEEEKWAMIEYTHNSNFNFTVSSTHNVKAKCVIDCNSMQI